MDLEPPRVVRIPAHAHVDGTISGTCTKLWDGLRARTHRSLLLAFGGSYCSSPLPRARWQGLRWRKFGLNRAVHVTRAYSVAGKTRSEVKMCRLGRASPRHIEPAAFE